MRFCQACDGSLPPHRQHHRRPAGGHLVSPRNRLHVCQSQRLTSSLKLGVPPAGPSNGRLVGPGKEATVLRQRLLPTPNMLKARNMIWKGATCAVRLRNVAIYTTESCTSSAPNPGSTAMTARLHLPPRR